MGLTLAPPLSSYESWASYFTPLDALLYLPNGDDAPILYAGYNS